MFFCVFSIYFIFTIGSNNRKTLMASDSNNFMHSFLCLIEYLVNPNNNNYLHNYFYCMFLVFDTNILNNLNMNQFLSNYKVIYYYN